MRRLAILITFAAGCGGAIAPAGTRARGAGKADDPTAAAADPFDGSSCSGPSLSGDAAQALVQNGPVTLGGYQIFARQRICNIDDGSCGDWGDPDPFDTVIRDAQSGTLVLSPEANEWGESPTLQLWTSTGRRAATCALRGEAYCAGLTWLWTNVYGESHENPVLIGGDEPAFIGPVTTGCAFLDAHPRDTDLPDLAHVRRSEAVLVGSF